MVTWIIIAIAVTCLFLALTGDGPSHLNVAYLMFAAGLMTSVLLRLIGAGLAAVF